MSYTLAKRRECCYQHHGDCQVRWGGGGEGPAIFQRQAYNAIIAVAKTVCPSQLKIFTACKSSLCIQTTPKEKLEHVITTGLIQRDVHEAFNLVVLRMAINEDNNSDLDHIQEYQLLPIYSKYPSKNLEKVHYDEESIISSSEASSSSLSNDECARERIPHRTSLKGLKEHIEEHFEQPELVHDCILGLSDGLTVPFALAAGLSSLGDSRVVIYGGLAELVSGAISMGLGGFLAAKSEADHYHTEREREAREVELYPKEEEEEIIELFEPYGLDREKMEPMMVHFRQDSEKFVDFMMRFELNLEIPNPNRSWISALTIGFSYFVGGIIPLLPYMFFEKTYQALYCSCFVTFFTLFCFGYMKSIYVRPNQAFIGALQTLAIGAIAAAFSYSIVLYSRAE
ncbi:MAG: VIT family-domain-containing protein [Benjaminiella poitrasii]|nr:MAG: VIT family-domain-containing protein [Benjaminiella poitrasii]